MIEVRASRPDDILKLNKLEVFKSDETLDQRIATDIRNGDSFCHTLVCDDLPIAIIGGSLMWPGVMHVWTVLGEEIKKCPSAFHKKVKEMIELYADGLKLWRMQMDVNGKYDSGLDWAEALGFKFECVMKKYGPDGSDHWLFARLF